MVSLILVVSIDRRMPDVFFHPHEIWRTFSYLILATENEGKAMFAISFCGNTMDAHGISYWFSRYFGYSKTCDKAAVLTEQLPL